MNFGVVNVSPCARAGVVQKYNRAQGEFLPPGMRRILPDKPGRWVTPRRFTGGE